MSIFIRTACLPITSRILTTQSSARFSTSIILQKEVAETIKDTANAVNQKISEGIAKGIELGGTQSLSSIQHIAKLRPESVAQKVKATMGASSGEVKGKGREVAGEARGKAHEMAGQVKGKASELEGRAKSNM